MALSDVFLQQSCFSLVQVFYFCLWRPENRRWLFCLQMGVLVQAAFCQPWRSDRVLEGRMVWEAMLPGGAGFKTHGSPSDSGQKTCKSSQLSEGTKGNGEKAVFKSGFFISSPPHPSTHRAKGSACDLEGTNSFSAGTLICVVLKERRKLDTKPI